MLLHQFTTKVLEKLLRWQTHYSLSLSVFWKVQKKEAVSKMVCELWLNLREFPSLVTSGNLLIWKVIRWLSGLICVFVTYRMACKMFVVVVGQVN